MLNQIKNLIASAIAVEVKPARTFNNLSKYPVIVKDISSSVTSGWYIQYNPFLKDDGTLRDGSETFSEVNIPNFSAMQNYIFSAKYYFLNGYGDIKDITRNGKPAKRVIYENNVQGFRFTVTSQAKSVQVTVTVTDETSPFYMMSIPFTVCLSNTVNGYYIIGSDKNFDNNTGYFKEYDASFAKGKKRFLQIYQEKNILLVNLFCRFCHYNARPNHKSRLDRFLISNLA